MAANAKTVNRRTGLVYTGAAFLIVVVGVRTLLQTADEGFNAISYVTMVALGLEFSLLLLYAFTIATMDVKEQPMTITLDTDVLTESFKSINFDVEPLVEQVSKLNTCIDDLKMQFEQFNESQKDNVNILETHTNSIVKLSENIESLVNEEVKRKVQEAISSLIASKIE